MKYSGNVKRLRKVGNIPVDKNNENADNIVDANGEFVYYNG